MTDEIEIPKATILQDLARTFLYTDWQGEQPTVKQFAIDHKFTEDELWDGLRFVIALEASIEHQKPELQRKIEHLEEQLETAVELARLNKKIYSNFPNDPDAKSAYLADEKRITDLRKQMGRMMGS